ncbi:MAG: AAA family ATPase [Acidimicrobiales bacterium]
MARTVTISSSFGAGGNVVGPEVARRLGLPFFDRAIPAAVAGRLAMPLEEADEQDEKAPSSWARVARAFANMAVPMAPQNLAVQDDPEHFRAETERILIEIAETTGGVVLGRGAMVVLRDRADVLRVRLDGDIDARVGRVAELQHLDLDEVRAMQRDTDGARDRYLRLFYRAHQDAPSLYDLVIDSIAIPLEACAQLIVAAAAAKGAG